MTNGARVPPDDEAQAWLERYVALWGLELRERGLLVGDPPRLRADFQDALMRAWRGELPPPMAVSPTHGLPPNNRPEDCA